MSKAEERSKEIMQVALDYANNLDDVKPTDDFSRNLCIALGQAFMKGAEWADEHPAEKDLELTWEDMMLIHKFIKDAMNYHLYKMMEGMEGQKVVYEEVLKRFRDFKESEEK